MGKEGSTKKKKRVMQGAFLFLFALLFSFLFSVILDRNLYWDFHQILRSPVIGIKTIGYYAYTRVGFHNLNRMRFYRILLLFPVYIFVGLHLIIPPKKIWENVYRYRWLIGLGVLVFFVACRFHGDSMVMYDLFGLQKGKGDALSYPVFSSPRAIRSDEYIVDNARKLYLYQTGQPYGEFSILTYLMNPLNVAGILIYRLLGLEFLYSFEWYAVRILGFLISFEFFMLLTRRKKGLSFACTMMLQLSAFFMWWSYPSHFIWSQGAIVCFWYFFEKEKTWQKLLFLLGTGLATVNFVRSFYPAWQVPLAFISLILAVWVIIMKQRAMSKLKRIHVIMLIGAAVAAAGFLLLYLQQSRAYIQTITSTVYPGRRYDNGGGGLREMFRYFPNTIFAYVETANNSEKAGIISLFPLPLVTGILSMVRKKKKDGLLISLMGLLAFLLWYIVFGLPDWLAKCTLMRFSTTGRCTDVAGYLTLLIFARSFGEGEKAPVKRSEDERGWLLRGILLLLMIGTAWFLTGYACKLAGPDYLVGVERNFFFPVFFGTVFWLLLIAPTEKRTRATVVILCLYSLAVGAYARPISSGLSSVYSKPAARKIMELNKEEPGKWISCDSWYLQSFTTLCGAKTMNYVNTVPNLELWHKMDPDRKYEDVYNRYAHVTVDLMKEGEGETSFQLNVADNFTLHIAPQDLSKMEVDYVIAQKELDIPNSTYELEPLYGEDGVWIYRIRWKE